MVFAQDENDCSRGCFHKIHENHVTDFSCQCGYNAICNVYSYCCFLFQALLLSRTVSA